jgi:hypothetical protein
MDQINKRLAKIYLDIKHPAGFSSAEKLAKASGVNLSKVREWLSGQDAYTQHKQVRRKFQRNRYYVTNMRVCYEADLASMQNISEENDSFNYILCVIDIFSKKAWGEPILDKRGATVAAALDRIFQRAPPPLKIRHDKGRELVNSKVEALLKKYNIQQIVTQNEDIKCAIVERFIRTLRGKMQKYFTHHGRERYVEVLQSLFDSYNNTVSTAIGIAPNDVTSFNIRQVNEYLYSGKGRYKKLEFTKHPPKFKLNDTVKITTAKHKLMKGHLPNWQYEIYKVVRIIRRTPVVYELVDWEGQPIKGVFYAEELQKVSATPDQSYRIEKIVEVKGSGNNKKLYVKWLGYADRFNSWINAKDLISYE